MRAEDPAVGVALVDHHELQPAQERRPAPVPRQQRAVQHVRVAEQPPAVPARPVACVHRGVAVQRGRPHVGQAERVEGPQLVGRERLGRRQVERGGPGVRGEPGEHGQLVDERLARRRAGGHHDVLAGVGQRRRRRPGGSTAPAHRARPNASRTSGGTHPGHSTGRPGRGGMRTAWRSGLSASASSSTSAASVRFRPVRRPPRGSAPDPGQHSAQQDLAAPGPRAGLRPRDTPGSPVPATHGDRGWHIGPTVRPSPAPPRCAIRVISWRAASQPGAARHPGQQSHQEAMVAADRARAVDVVLPGEATHPALLGHRSRAVRPVHRRCEQPERLVEPVSGPRRSGVHGGDEQVAVGGGHVVEQVLPDPHGVLGRHRHLTPLRRIPRAGGAGQPQPAADPCRWRRHRRSGSRARSSRCRRWARAPGSAGRCRHRRQPGRRAACGRATSTATTTLDSDAV